MFCWYGGSCVFRANSVACTKRDSSRRFLINFFFLIVSLHVVQFSMHNNKISEGEKDEMLRRPGVAIRIIVTRKHMRRLMNGRYVWTNLHTHNVNTADMIRPVIRPSITGR